MSRFNVGAVAAATLGIFLGATAFTFYFGKGASYLSSDPRACVNCHIMQDQFASWQKSSHKAVAVCVDCHLPTPFFAKWRAKVANGYNHSAAFTLQNFHEPIRIHSKNKKLLLDSCMRCHAALVMAISAGHQNPAADSRCTVCHSRVGHAAS